MPQNFRNFRIPAFALFAVSMSNVSAQSNLTLYGRLNVALESISVGGRPSSRSIQRESNNRSVLGFRGDESLGRGYRAIFQIEGALSIDTGAATSFTNRDTRVGLVAPWGTLFMGHWVLPYLFATSNYDPYYPTTAGYMSLMGNGSASSTNHLIDRSSFDRRQQNSVHFWTPVWRGVTGRLAYAFNDGEMGPQQSLPTLWSSSLTFEDGPWHLTLAREEHRNYQGPGLDDSGTKLGAAYRTGNWRASLTTERLRYETPRGVLTRGSTYMSAVWQFGSGSLRLAYTHAGKGKGPSGSRVGFIAAGPATGASQLTLGYDHALSQRTGLYVYASRIRNQARASYDFAINSAGIREGEKPQVVAIGIRQNF